MKNIWVIANAAFREAIRSKIFLNLLGLAAIIVLAGLVVESGSLGSNGRIFHDIAHAAVSVGGSMVALFLGINLIANDIERKTLHVLLTRPVTRLEVVVGKYLGLSLVMVVNTLASLACYLLVAAVGRWQGLSVWGPVSILFLLGEFLIVGAIAIMFSCLSGTTTAGIFSLMVFVAGRLGEQISLLAERSSSPAVANINRVVSRLIPDLTAFDLNPDLPPTLSTLGLTTLYGVCWSAALVLLATVIFQYRDLK